jgi:hypothetical protein
LVAIFELNSQGSSLRSNPGLKLANAFGVIKLVDAAVQTNYRHVYKPADYPEEEHHG